MKKLFADLPEAIINIQEIIDKVEIYSLYRDVLLQIYDIPEEFINPEMNLIMEGENAYLRHLTMVGAEKDTGN
jgi:DNA polymerase-3 subunit alpha